MATPIGNLGDLSSRAREVLGAVALVLAEDTRRVRQLLAHFGAHRDPLAARAQRGARVARPARAA